MLKVYNKHANITVLISVDILGIEMHTYPALLSVSARYFPPSLPTPPLCLFPPWNIPVVNLSRRSERTDHSCCVRHVWAKDMAEVPVSRGCRGGIRLSASVRNLYHSLASASPHLCGFSGSCLLRLRRATPECCSP